MKTLKLNLTDEARQEFIKAGLKGAERTLKSQGKEHYKKMATAKWKKWKEKQAGDNSETTIE